MYQTRSVPVGGASQLCFLPKKLPNVVGRQHRVGDLSAAPETNIGRKVPSEVVNIVSRGQAMCCQALTTRESEYNRVMQQAMGWDHVSPFEYHYDRGLYWHEVGPNLICGSQPRNPDDVSLLKAEGVTTIVNLQQDQDMQHWNVNCHDIQQRCLELGINWVRRPARDFDPHSLRRTIPAAVQAVFEGLKNNGRVYVHCTAGLGRAPAVCIAYLHWFHDMQLDQAYKHVTDIRPCGPKRDAIRGATYDLMSGGDFHSFERLPPHAFASMNQEDRHAVQYRCLRGF